MENQAHGTIDQYLDTLTSPPKTTVPAQTDSSPTECKPGEKREIVFVCPKHGDVLSTVHWLLTDWSAPRCEACADEERAAADRREVERRREDEESNRRHEARRRDERFEASGVPARYRDKGFADYAARNEAARKALKACSDFASAFPAQRAAGTSLILCGTAGTGKTHLAAAVAREVTITHGLSARFTTAGKVFRAVKATYGKANDDTEDAALQRFTSPDLLVIDEVGVQFGSDFERNILFEVVNERYGSLLPTVLISNLALDGLREYAGDRVIDRMKENGGKLVVFDWSSHRGMKP